MTNNYFDWPARSAANRFVRFDTVRAEDANDALDLASAGFEKLPTPTQVWGNSQNYAVATGSLNNWAATVSATHITSLYDGLKISVKFPAANTITVPTLNLNGLGAKTIASTEGAAIAVGDIQANAIVTLTYNATHGNFQLFPNGAALAATAAASAALAVAAAGTAAAVGGSAIATYSTTLVAQAMNIPSARDYIITAGYSAAGDGGSAWWKKVVAEPSHDGKFQSADGAWWELMTLDIDPRILGASNVVTVDSAPQIRSALSAHRGIPGSRVWLPIEFGYASSVVIIADDVIEGIGKDQCGLRVTTASSGSFHGILGEVDSPAHRATLRNFSVWSKLEVSGTGSFSAIRIYNAIDGVIDNVGAYDGDGVCAHLIDCDNWRIDKPNTGSSTEARYLLQDAWGYFLDGCSKTILTNGYGHRIGQGFAINADDSYRRSYSHVVSTANDEFYSHDPLFFTNLATGDELRIFPMDGVGTMPAGITDNATYFAVKTGTDTDPRFKLAATHADALAGAPIIDITTAGSGTTMKTRDNIALFQVDKAPITTSFTAVADTDQIVVDATFYRSHTTAQYPVYATTSGVLPAGISANSVYWTVKATAVQLNFDVGTVAILVGDTVTDETAATATVAAVVVTSGSFAGGDAAGFLLLTGMSGTWADNDEIRVGGVQRATANGVPATVNTVKLYDTLANAFVGGATGLVNITDLGTGTHRLRLAKVLTTPTLGSTDEVNVGALLYEILRTGDPIHFKAAGGTPLGGLTENTTYYVIRTTTQSMVKLATTVANARAGTAIALTASAGTATQWAVFHSSFGANLSDSISRRPAYFVRGNRFIGCHVHRHMHHAFNINSGQDNAGIGCTASDLEEYVGGVMAGGTLLARAAFQIKHSTGSGTDRNFFADCHALRVGIGFQAQGGRHAGFFDCTVDDAEYDGVVINGSQDAIISNFRTYRVKRYNVWGIGSSRGQINGWNFESHPNGTAVGFNLDSSGGWIFGAGRALGALAFILDIDSGSGGFDILPGFRANSNPISIVPTTGNYPITARAVVDMSAAAIEYLMDTTDVTQVVRMRQMTVSAVGGGATMNSGWNGSLTGLLAGVAPAAGVGSTTITMLSGITGLIGGGKYIQATPAVVGTGKVILELSGIPA